MTNTLQSDLTQRLSCRCMCSIYASCSICSVQRICSFFVFGFQCVYCTQFDSSLLCPILIVYVKLQSDKRLTAVCIHILSTHNNWRISLIIMIQRTNHGYLRLYDCIMLTYCFFYYNILGELSHAILHEPLWLKGIIHFQLAASQAVFCAV